MLLLTLASLVALTTSEIRSPAYKLTPSPASPAAASTVSPARAAQLFWSYYSRPSLERAPLLASGYQRDSPAVWSGQEAGKGGNTQPRFYLFLFLRHMCSCNS